jgi:2-dehydro-3-deoxyphosphogluconate aldolase/(4S)-4-hydroxy-2-oxoglutarate aldolase
MDNKTLLDQLLKNGVFAVIRMPDQEKLLKTVEAISKGGVKNIEITMTVPNAGEAIANLSKHFDKEVMIGAGTVAELRDAEEVLKAGAQFVVSPMLNLEVVQKCQQAGVPMAPGCYTPTEIYSGWKAGADIVKVFPATSLGPTYFKDILAPFPFLKLMPTGGVSIENVGEWVKAGASAVALGSNLLDKAAIAEGRFEVLTEKAKRLTDNFNEARAKLK